MCFHLHNCKVVITRSLLVRDLASSQNRNALWWILVDGRNGAEAVAATQMH